MMLPATIPAMIVMLREHAGMQHEQGDERQ
jgi:hypothetical protein